MDNFGPILIPAGQTVEIARTYSFRRITDEYEGHDLKSPKRKAIIDGAEATSYFFEKNYYWMMGDNRHNSLDARKWGYVPKDHIAGKPVFIWMTTTSTAKAWIKPNRPRVHVNGQGNAKVISGLSSSLGYTKVQFVRKRKNRMPTLLSTAYLPPALWVAHTSK